MEINFGSTYRIPITHPGINKAKKIRLREFITSERGLAPSSSGGYCRISMPQEKDASFEQQLRQLGYRAWQKFDAHSVPNQAVGKNDNTMDIYIREALAKGEYITVGKI